MTQETLIFAITGCATAGVIVRPFGVPEAVWALLGTGILLVFGLMPPATAWAGVVKGEDVYLFLTGMMVLSEVARREGFFDWVAAVATRAAKGSSTRLFGLVYIVGTLTTIFLSNDATAVVLTPAVYAATRTARVDRPLPYLYICAFIANAASFVLPISNPANLVLFTGGEMPGLARWLSLFALPSLVSIVVTFAVLRWCLRHELRGLAVATNVETPALLRGGKIAAAGILVTALVLVAASATGRDLGWPTFVAGLGTALVVLLLGRQTPVPLLRSVSWGVLPLVAGLFVFVEALDATSLSRILDDALRAAIGAGSTGAAIAGAAIAFGSNLVNNLPAGLIAASTLQHVHAPALSTGALLIGVDLGPNLSVTGSLATILWLTALRREKQNVSALTFLKLGILVMTPALVGALAALILVA